ncbi:MAG: TRAP transporter substrate-binding protein DctP [Pseudomonadota bacterium]
MKRPLIAALIALGMALGTQAARADDTTLRITLQLPLKSHLGQNLLLFQEIVERESAGEIDVEIYDSAQLYKDSEVPQAVGSGAIEMGVASFTRYVGEIPAVDIFYMPFLFNTPELVQAAVAPDSPVRTLLDEAILGTGSRVLWWQAYGGNVLLSKDGPIATPDDMAGKKVRVYGKTLGTWVQAAGGAPTLISGSEQYLAYQRGTVDIGMTGFSGVQSRKLWEVMDTVTVTNNADIEFIVVINEAFWEGLPEGHREIISAAAREAEIAVRNAMAEIEATARSEAEANGMTVVELTPEQIEAWKAAAQPVFDAYLAGSGDLGKQVHDAALALSGGS